MLPIILHVDMNSYFASVEQQDNLAWRGKPLGVCEHLGGIIIAASIEAKRWGIKTGTPVWEARKLYPKIILTKTHPDRYRLYTNRLMKILADYTGYVEQYSIDEAFLDVSRVCSVLSSRPKPNASEAEWRDPSTRRMHSSVGMTEFSEAVSIAMQIKLRMKKEVGDWLTCSIGIAENKLLAKIASDMQKPDGLVVVSNSKYQIPNNKQIQNSKSQILNLTTEDLYKRLNLIDIPGIGHRQEKRLNNLGIHTLAELRDYPRSKLVAHFGIMGHHLHEMGNLRSSWKPVVEQEDIIKSIGHMYTLPQEYRETKFFVPVLYKLSEMVARRMRAQNLTGNILHFHIDDQKYESYGQSKKLGYYIQDGREIFFESVKIFESNMRVAVARQYKLIGVTIAGLVNTPNQPSLFQKDERIKRLVKSLDKINEKYGDFTISRVPVHQAGQAFRESIGFGRIKEHIRLASFR